MQRPRWAKGYYRAGVALYHMGQVSDALDMVRYRELLSIVTARVCGLKCASQKVRDCHDNLFQKRASTLSPVSSYEAFPQFEIASVLAPHSRGVQGAVFDLRKKLNLLPLGAVPETGKVYLRPGTHPVLLAL